MNVTGGKVVFRRTVQPADYESKSAEVELSFTYGDDLDPEPAGEAVEELLNMAKDKVLTVLGLRKRSDKDVR